METRGRAFVLGELRTMQALATELAENARRESGQEAAIFITHGTTIAAYVCGVLRLDLDDYDRFRIDSGSITVVDLAQDKAVLLSLNETSHLTAADAERGNAP